jgi:sigma-B regulation protein RsbU (phosphoserine phosphatase)
LALDQPVSCDRVRVGQLLSNLVSNALSHGEAGSPVRVRARTADGVFTLSVANTGPPIPSAVMENLFQPFFRGAVRASAQGLGLGLYIASEIARAHGGSLEAASDSGQTVFTFTMKLEP